MIFNSFHIKIDHDAASAFKKLMETMTSRSTDLDYKQIDDYDFLVTFYQECEFDHVFDQFWDEGDWIRT